MSRLLAVAALAIMIAPNVQAFSQGLDLGDGGLGAIVRSANGNEGTTVLRVDSYTIQAGVVRTIPAGQALVIIARDFIDIQGSLVGTSGSGGGALGATGSAGMGVGGSGASSSSSASGGVAATSTNVPKYLALQTGTIPSGALSDSRGSGGGGGQTGTAGTSTFGGAGGGGGYCAAGGNGGAAGAAAVVSGTGGTGSAGGATIVLVAPRVTLGTSSQLTANGVAGNPATGTTPNASSGGGGGSGGLIAIWARVLDEAAGATVTANGGAGGAGGGSGGSGAAGGAGGTTGCNPGGNGNSPTTGGGGGGGGAGGAVLRHVDSDMIWGGAWSSTTTYAPGDAVLSGGVSYVSKTTHTNQPPASNADDWELLGADGYSSITTTTSEPAGANCAEGGRKVESGLDNGDGGGTARDGTLQAGEIDHTAYVCHGATGATGATGPQGPTGPDGPQGDPGPIGITWQGQWLSTTTYAERDAVHYAGSAWYALTPNTNSAPAPGSTDWDYIANADGNVVIPETMNVDSSLADYWVPILIMGGLVLLFLRLRRPLSALVASMAFLGLFIVGAWPVTLTLAFVLLLLTIWLEAIAGDKIYQKMFKQVKPEGEPT